MSELEWIRLGDICAIEKGTTGLAKATPGKYPLVATSVERRTCETYQFDAKAVCIPLVSSTGHGKKSLNNVHYQEGRFALGSILAAVIPKDETRLSARYLHTYLQMNKDRVIVPLMKGAANVSLSVTAISNLKIPIPPISKQHAALKRLDSISGEHKELLLEFDSQSQMIKALRRQTFQDAIEGKLTAEWRKDNQQLISGEHHALKLLEKLQVTHGNTQPQKTRGRGAMLVPIDIEEKPFTLPTGWVWCRLGDLGSTNIGLTYSPSDISQTGTPVLRSNNIKDGRINFENLIRVNTQISENQYAKSGDILICARNGSKALVGKAAQIKELSEPTAFGAFMAIFRSECNDYIEIFLNSPSFRQLIDQVNTMTINQLTQSNLKTTLFPLPSLPEQKIIVATTKERLRSLQDLEIENLSQAEQAKLLMKSILCESFTA